MASVMAPARLGNDPTSIATNTNTTTTTTTSSSSSSSTPRNAPPRKRRRKTVSGASDDCFACRRRNAVCDRKRPYCTQCIEIGKECSGYKTTLTWGVGVASRGKLRGKSTPVAAQNGDASGSANVTEEVRRRKSSTIKIKEEKSDGGSIDNGLDPQLTPVTASSYPPTYQPLLPTISAGQEGWHIPQFLEQAASPQHDAARFSVPRHRSLQHIHTSLGPRHDTYAFPRSGSSIGSLPETDFHSPMEYPLTPGSITFAEPFSQNHTSVTYTSHPIPQTTDPYMDTLSSSIDSLRSVESYSDSHMLETISSEPSNHFTPLGFDQDEMLFSPGLDMALSFNPFDQQEQSASEEDVVYDSKVAPIFNPRFSTPFFHVSPRLQSLMEYYDRHVCTYLVAFDGAENPYRKILQLASQNEGLQNAIAALATNNLRMRRKEQPRQVGFVQEITDAFDGSTRSREFDEPTPEETCYKQMSIDQLNMQLTDPRAAHDDSVLATLLILCLFHVCDSGFSKFKTQLAGVQKLLSLRSPNEQSDFTRWVEMFFIWFDVMTSAVNDRETQIKGESLDMMDYSANLGALEQFSGCDGRLFKLIARLGRLNLLAQGKPVRPQSNGVPKPSMMRNSSFSHMRKTKTPRSLSPANYANMDGNGWGAPITSSDEEDERAASDSYSSPDDRQEFWNEWNDIRQRLHAFKMEAAHPPPPGTPAPEFELGQRDLLHINESFRYSALLYTERLGHPLLPSSHPTFQRHVSHGLSHIAALDVSSCVTKFLLWPLFIIGTECVDPAHRALIRARCLAVATESGFYNNISGLEVLERVWRDGDHLGGGPGGEDAEIRARRYGQAFRWRKAMDRVDGEYILI